MFQFACPKCGKQLTLSRSDAGRVVLCNACGAAVQVPKNVAVAVAASELAGMAAAAAPAARAADSRQPSPRPGVRRTVPGAGWWALLAVAVLIAAGVPTSILLLRPGGGGGAAIAQKRTSNPANVRENADLLTLKSEAETLAINGKLPEAHAKYRELQQRAAIRDIKDPLLWDILERAKVDQDHIYTILLAKAQLDALGPGVDAPMLPSRALNPPGPTSRPNDSVLATVNNAAPSPAAADGLPQPPDLAASRPAEQDVWADLRSATAPATIPARARARAIVSPAARSLTRMPALPSTQPAGAVVDPSEPLTDEQIGPSIRRGVDYLLDHSRNGELAGGSAAAQVTPQWREGINALCDYALLQASQSITDDRLDVKGPAMKQMLEKLKSTAMDSDPKGTWQPVTYGRGLRAAALAVYNRPEDREALREDAAWLVTAEVLGGYTYDDRFGQAPERWKNAPQPPMPAGQSRGGGGGGGERAEVYAHNGEPIPPRMPGAPWTYPPPAGSKKLDPQSNRRIAASDIPWDNSNSQYGLMGVWACAESGVEIPDWYWKDVEKHWTGWQLKDGQWGYKGPDRTGSLAMTAAGVASLFVTADWLDAGQLRGAVGREPFSKPLAAGLRWLEQADNCAAGIGGEKSHSPGYDLFSVERAGLASG